VSASTKFFVVATSSAPGESKSFWRRFLEKAPSKSVARLQRRRKRLHISIRRDWCSINASLIRWVVASSCCSKAHVIRVVHGGLCGSLTERYNLLRLWYAQAPRGDDKLHDHELDQEELALGRRNDVIRRFPRQLSFVTIQIPTYLVFQHP
jgi:hypothetical protein